MNLELPFEELRPSELEEQLARIDRELDALFLDEVEDAVERLRAIIDAPSAPLVPGT